MHSTTGSKTKASESLGRKTICIISKDLHRNQHTILATESCHLYKVYVLSNTKEILKFIILETDRKTLVTRVNK